MITILLTCTLLAGEAFSLLPPTGWEVVRITGKVARQSRAAPSLPPSAFITGGVATCFTPDSGGLVG
jgi:hypothetical protein